MSESRSRGISEGRITCGSRGMKGVHLSTKTGLLERFDSFFELIRMRILDEDDSVLSWTKAHQIRIEYTWQSKKRTYVPDFLIVCNESSTLEEIKGYEDPDKLKAKLEALSAYCASHKLKSSYMNFDALNEMSHQKFNQSIAHLRSLYKKEKSCE